MAAGDLDKTLTYTENVPEDIGYSTELSGASGTVKIEIYPASTATYPGRLQTGIFTDTASIWHINEQKWVCEGTQAEVNAALDDITFFPEDGVTSTVTYTVDVYDGGSTSAALGHPSTITLTGSSLVPAPTLSTSSTSAVSYTADSRVKLSLPTVGHPNNQVLKIQLRIKMHSADPNYQSHDTYVSSAGENVTHSTGPITTQRITPYGYFDIRMYVGNTRPLNPTVDGTLATAIVDDGTPTYTITAGGSGYTSPPTCTITPGSHDSAGTATAVIDTDPASATYQQVTSITSSSQYITAPTVSISGGGGSSATATVAITDYVWELVGTVAEINEAFQNLYYVSPADSSYVPTVYLEIRVTDGINTI